jgi:hypothetical protein
MTNRTTEHAARTVDERVRRAYVLLEVNEP